ncbi:MAG: hypothetical protein LBL28_05495 [Treponema sp.]|jgi:hypothetical protein|nr:hypothetical protein [Treponema sp.]
MYSRNGKLALFILFISSFLYTCGELDTVFPSNGTYQVNALVNETSLNDCSLISKNDRIYPYFASSVLSDPDITGLVVFLQTPSGYIINKKIHYTLETVEEDAPVENSGEVIDDTVPEDALIKVTENINIIEPVKIDESEILIPVNRLDKGLPFFLLPDTLEIGPYTMIFQILGKREVLYREEKPVYYLDDAEFSLTDIQKYLPDVSGGSPLIPPGIAIMLEAQVVSDERLDPYIVWYSGRKRLSEGRISEGGGFILWKAPEQTGFHTIRAEVFPRRPNGVFPGISREISLPISSKTENGGYFSGESANILYWYQFQGNLQDSKNPVSTERALVPRGEKNSRWIPEGNIYGLAVDSQSAYLLPSFSFMPSGEAQGAGRFMLRFKPVSEGLVFSSCFKSESAPADMVYMNLSVAGETLNLDIIAPERSAAITLNYTEEAESFITLFIDFVIHENYFEARIDRENDPAPPAEPKRISLLNPLNGEGSFQFGASLKNTEVKEDQEELVPEEEKPAYFPVTAILDEFAFSRLEEYVFPEEPEPETEDIPVMAEETEPALPEEEPLSLVPGEKPEPGTIDGEKPASQAVPDEKPVSQAPDEEPVSSGPVVLPAVVEAEELQSSGEEAPPQVPDEDPLSQSAEEEEPVQDLAEEPEDLLSLPPVEEADAQLPSDVQLPAIEEIVEETVPNDLSDEISQPNPQDAS